MTLYEWGNKQVAEARVILWEGVICGLIIGTYDSLASVPEEYTTERIISANYSGKTWHIVLRKEERNGTDK